MVQRSQRLLPRRRPPRHHAGDRVQQARPLRPRPARVLGPRRGLRRGARGEPRLRRALRRGTRDRARALRGREGAAPHARRRRAIAFIAVSGRPIAIYAGYLVRCPIGGYLWQVVHYLRGLRDAGVDVWFWEDTRHTWQAYDPIARSDGADYDAGIRIAGETLASVGFADRWIFHDSIHDRSAGAGRDAARWLFANARILINAAGVHRFSAEERAGKTCIYVDMDPAYTQLRVAGGDRLLAEMLAEHDLHFTFGENIGTDRSRIPTGGFD